MLLIQDNQRGDRLYLFALFWCFSFGFVCYNAARVLIGLNSHIQSHGFNGVALFGIFIALIQVAIGSTVGRFIDHVGSMNGLFIGAGTMVLASTIGIWMSSSWIMLGAYTALLSIGSLFINVAAQKGVGEVVRKDQRTRYFSWLSQLVALTNVVGPISVGVVIASFGQSEAYSLLLIISFMTTIPLPAVLLWSCWRFNMDETTPEIRGIQARSSWLDLITLNQFPISLCSGVLFACVTSFILATPILAIHRGLGADEIGIVIGIYGAAAIISRLFTAKLIHYIPEKHLLGLSFLIAAVGFFSLAIAVQILAFYCSSILLGIGLGWSLPLTISLTHRNAKKGQEGALLAKLVSLNKLSEALVLSVILLFSGSKWIEGPFLINGFLLIISSLIILHSIHKRESCEDI
ncbi:MFS transporter [Endozoicomonas sp. ALB115]|uniref:MFS transporter n=1 Tax=Endozoicomonas sp. ALB115 TaxID=3403074 RepID=UPI003BB702B1